MGQYFKAVNLDKREFVCPWCIGGLAKLWEWAASNHGSIFTLLLRKSDAIDNLEISEDETQGRWAGDRIVLVGDYDTSGLYVESEQFRNISEAVVRDWNEFIGQPDRCLKFNPHCRCSSHES